MSKSRVLWIVGGVICVLVAHVLCGVKPDAGLAIGAVWGFLCGCKGKLTG